LLINILYYILKAPVIYRRFLICNLSKIHHDLPLEIKAYDFDHIITLSGNVTLEKEKLKVPIMNIVHIHNVLDILVETNKPLKEAELTEMISGKFGHDVQFASCADQVFPKEEVVRFLLSKNKITLEGGLIRFNVTSDRC
jgi:probable metal-binding protein